MQLIDDTSHQLVLQTRYALEAAGELLYRATGGHEVAPDGPGSDLKQLAEALPYLWSGGRDAVDPWAASRMFARTAEIAQRYGLTLPPDRQLAAILTVRLAHDLLWTAGLGHPSNINASHQTRIE